MTRTSSTDDVPSRVLVHSFEQGDETALAALLERHLPDLKTYVAFRTGRQLLAQESSSDLVQSVCREVLEELEHFAFESEGKFRHWLFRVAERKLLERVRFWGRERRDPKRLAAHHVGDGACGDSSKPLARDPSPSQHAVAREQLERVQSAYRKLPAEYQEVILLVRVVGLSHREAAQRLERTEGAVRMLLHRALARLTSHI